jgi:phospholipid-binding lipoprotein MlaA
MKPALLLAVLAVVLGGCASQSVSIRGLPAEDPAAQTAAAVEAAAAFAGAAASAATADANAAGEAARDTEVSAPPVTPADAPPMVTYDPWERMNRFTYRFNAKFDEAIYLPVANGYRHVPAPIRSGVHNFFDNLAEVRSVVNYTLQWRLKLGVRSLGRFVINSTLGIGGLIDTAAKLHLPGVATGFSETLAKWGMHPGPYLVIPFLGPSTLRDGIGYLGDYGVGYTVNVAGLYRGTVSWVLLFTYAIDERANTDFRYYATGSPFEYENIRFLYVRKRLIEDEGLRRKRPKAAGEPAGK